jgi:replication factor C subunit 2/4
MNNNYLWVEKYRPAKLDDICSQTNIIKSLKSSIYNKNLPHLIFFGPSGCGKTSTIIALAKEIFGLEHYNNRIIELNASDERGINIIREKIKTYAKQSIKKIDNLPPWKIIILDEADTMTIDSQFALRRIMEQYSKITRFCIICNYYNKIIDPIISRCSMFRFKAVNSIDITSKLEYICNNEKLNCTVDIINKIKINSRGDLRKAINLLQKCYCSLNNKSEFYNLSLENCSYENLSITKDSTKNSELILLKLDELSGYIPSDIFNNLIQLIFLKDYKNVEILLNDIYNNGYSIVNQILLFHDFIINSTIESEKKAKIVCKIAEIDQYLIKGCDEFIQLMNLIYYIMITI